MEGSGRAWRILWLGVFGVAPPLAQQREQQVLRRIGAMPLSRLTFMGSQIAWRLTTMTYLADALRQTMLGAPALFPLRVDFAVLGGCLIALSGLALRFFRWE